MITDYYTDIVNFIEKNYDIKLKNNLLKSGEIIQKIGSYNFIEIVVKVEEFFDVEFDDDMLNRESYQCLDDFINYTISLIENKCIDKL